MKLHYLFVPFHFLWASVLYLYYRASIFVAPAEILRPIVALSVVLVLLVGLVYWISKDSKTTGVLLTIFVIGFWAYDWFSLVVVVTIGIGIVALSLRKNRFEARQLIIVMNLVGFFLLFYTGFLVITDLPELPTSYYSNLNRADLAPHLAPPKNGVPPDIYYIVLDGYTRADVLEELYGFDNSEFIQLIEQMGFIVPAQGRSNYPKTVLSVASTLNMEYIADLTPGLNDQMNWWLMAPYIDHNRTRIALEQLGYEMISIETGWSITDNRTADQYLHAKPLALTDFENYFLDSTPMALAKPFLSHFAFVSSYSSHRDLLNAEFMLLAQIPDIQGPKFTFVHVLAPHPPFAFDVNGIIADPPYPFTFDDANDFPSSPQQYRDGYVGKLRFLNRQLEWVLRELIANSEVPPIIILQADHGGGRLTDFGSVANTCLKERFSVFAAYYLPGIAPDAIPDDLAAVNVFRVIFNEVFDAKLPLLERAHFFSNSAYIYDGEDVTSLVDSCRPD